MGILLVLVGFRSRHGGLLKIEFDTILSELIVFKAAAN
jgi:hypothetical protein